MKVSFIDEIHEDQPLAKIIDIESFKKYNFIVGMPKEEHIKGTHINASNCQCCLIFWPFDIKIWFNIFFNIFIFSGVNKVYNIKFMVLIFLEFYFYRNMNNLLYSIYCV